MRISLFFVFVLLCAIVLDDAIVLAKKNKQESEETHYDERQTKNTKKADHNRNEQKKPAKKERKQNREVYEDDNSGEISYSDKRQKRQIGHENENTKLYKKNKKDQHYFDDSEEVQNKQKQKKPKKIEHHQQLIEEETNEESEFAENQNTCNCQRYKNNADKKRKENIYRRNPKEFPCEGATNGDIEVVKHKQKTPKTKNPPGYYSRSKIVDETQDDYENDFCSRCSECYKEKHKSHEKRGRQHPRENFDEEDGEVFHGEPDFNL